VWFDLSLTIPHVSQPAQALRDALELAPVSKLLYASDAARTPELYWLAARWWRRALAEVLPELLPEREAEEAARLILRENARRHDRTRLHRPRPADRPRRFRLRRHLLRRLHGRRLLRDRRAVPDLPAKARSGGVHRTGADEGVPGLPLRRPPARGDEVPVLRDGAHRHRDRRPRRAGVTRPKSARRPSRAGRP